MISYASFIDLSPPLSLWHFFSQLSHVGPDNFFPQIVILGLLFVNFTNCPPSKLNCTFANFGPGPRLCILTNCCFRQLSIIFSCGSRSLFFLKICISAFWTIFNILQIVVLSFGSRGDQSSSFLGMVKVAKWSE